MMSLFEMESYIQNIRAEFAEIVKSEKGKVTDLVQKYITKCLEDVHFNGPTSFEEQTVMENLTEEYHQYWCRAY